VKQTIEVAKALRQRRTREGIDGRGGRCVHHDRFSVPHYASIGVAQSATYCILKQTAAIACSVLETLPRMRKIMSINKSRRRSSPQKTPQAQLAAKLASFYQNKNVLLDILRNVHERGPRTGPFDAKTAWNSLTQIADLYLRQMRRRKLPVAVCIKRLNQIANALGRARVLLDRAKQDTVITELYGGWYAQANLSYATSSTADFSRAYEEVASMPARVKKLEMAARRAAKNMRPVRGRPKGPTVLPQFCVEALAKVYRTSTERKPGRGDGPFAQFVREFLSATGQHMLKYPSLVDVIKATRF
jgi:hypothetical protein